MKDEILQYLEKSVLCWLATADESGMPNVSPKELFTYGGNNNILIANIASPKSVRNISLNPKVCLSFIDVFEQIGFKVKGTAELLKVGDNKYDEHLTKLRKLADEHFPIQEIIEITVEETAPIKAPSYFLFPEITTEQQIQNSLDIYRVKKINP